MDDTTTIEDVPMRDVESIARNRRIFNRVFLTLFAVLLVGFAYWVGRQQAEVTMNGSVAVTDARVIGAAVPADAGIGQSIDFSLFWDVWDILRTRYVDRTDLDAQKMLHGAISGMIAATGDPYTMYFDEKELKEFTDDLEGTFEGIGAEIGMRNQMLTVIAPLAESPAERAGLRAGDIIGKIDNESTVDLSVDEAVRRMRGPAGTTVTLTVLHKDDETPVDVTITRDTIEVKSVKSEMGDDGIGTITLVRFGEDTAALFTQAGRELRRQGLRGLIIDVRNNPGGFLDSAVRVAGDILPRDSVVVISEDYDGKREEMRTDTVPFLNGIPIVVLINGGSASASEILAGALKDTLADSVRLIGEKSFGKGSVQDLIQLRHGSGLKVTIAKWLTPAGHQINHVGIAPDEVIENTREDMETDADPQRDAAVRYLQERLR